MDSTNQTQQMARMNIILNKVQLGQALDPVEQQLYQQHQHSLNLLANSSYMNPPQMHYMNPRLNPYMYNGSNPGMANVSMAGTVETNVGTQAAAAASNGAALAPAGSNGDALDGENESPAKRAKKNDIFSGLKLENNQSFWIPQSEQYAEALVEYQLDQIEMDLERDAFEKGMALKREVAEARFFEKVGLLTHPLNAFKAGYAGKPGPKGKNDDKFDRQPFSTRLDYYKRNADRTKMAFLIPSTDKDVKECIRAGLLEKKDDGTIVRIEKKPNQN